VALLTAIESTRTLPTHRVVFSEAQIMQVSEGAVEIETVDSTHLLTRGMTLALGAGRWCIMRPQPRVRMWTVFADESFLRVQVGWFFPDHARVLGQLHPRDWDGGAAVIRPGAASLALVEPLLRQISILNDGTHTLETAATRSIELFARWVRIVTPALVLPDSTTVHPSAFDCTSRPVHGRLSDTGTVGAVGHAVRLLKERMGEPWTVTALAEEVALSRAHLTRLFTLRVGVPPIRFLTEIRLTEFTRLMEETEMTVADAARAVGWRDARIASSWFLRRYGITPSNYRLSPHPHHPNGGDNA
jgi:AraC-like DNA-binding protein